MKISNSKKQLARIITENGGWRDGAEFSAQDKDGEVFFYDTKPTKRKESEVWHYSGVLGGDWIECERALPNWHQTVLSRDEYSHLYPVAEPAPEPVVEPEAKPTIEHLAADYRNAKDYAERKQQEADAAKADAEGKLAALVALVAAGTAIGLALSVAEPEQEKPAKPYTGKFYNDGTDKRNFQTLCDGCGKRYGLHYGDRCERGGSDA